MHLSAGTQSLAFDPAMTLAAAWLCLALVQLPLDADAHVHYPKLDQKLMAGAGQVAIAVGHGGLPAF